MVKAQSVLPSFEDQTVSSSDGESLLFIRHFGCENPRLHFLIVHGALEHSGRHHDLVKYLTKNFSDVAVTVFDHLGHGKSGGIRAYTPSFKVYVEDLNIVGAFAQEKNLPDTKNIICCHSLGGLITITRLLNPAYGWSYPVSGLIFSSPCIRPKLPLGASSEMILQNLDKLSGKFHLPLIYSGKSLTHDSERANDFDTDDLIPRFITVRMAREIIEASHQVRGLSYYLRIPSLFLIAGTDYIVDAESTTLFAQGIEKRLTKIVQYPEHFHDLWNEVDRFEIFETMKKWVEKLSKETL